MTTPRLAIVIVSWNGRDLLRTCLHALTASLRAADLAATIVVVDNHSQDGTPAMVRAEFPAVRLLEPGGNLGFVGGNNLALHALGFAPESPAPTTPRPAYVLLLNPDTTPAPDAVPRLVTYLDTHPEVIAVGPRLRYPDGSTQSSRRRFPTRLTFFWESTPLHRWWPANPWAQRYHCADHTPDMEQPVDWLVGAALLVRGSAIEHAGMLDARFFMYSEELEWQARLQQASAPQPSRRFETSGRVMYLPTAEVVHHEGHSSAQVPLARHLHFQQSKLRLAALWYGSRFARLLYRFLWLCYLYDLLAESLKHLLGHRPDLRRQRIGVYGAVLVRLGEYTIPMGDPRKMH